MDFNFELILTLLFLLCGLSWLLNKSIRGGEDTLIGFLASMAPVLGIVLVLRSFVIEPFQIPSKSMVPTLKVGDYILVNKWIYGDILSHVSRCSECLRTRFYWPG